MAMELDAFLSRQSICAEEIQTWGGGSLPLRVRSYLCQDLPPTACVTSIRGFVFRNAEVIVIRDAGGKVHLMPGGRCEAGETWEETLRREVLEEAGWTLQSVRLLGFMHFYHLAPRPEGYRYAYPEFVQLICMGEAGEYRSDAMEIGGYIEAVFQPLEQIHSSPLLPSERVFLDAALQRR